jgi:glutamyl-tRNA synthetase
MTTKRRFYGALRVAVCGNQVSPPLGVSLELLGRNTALARIDNALPLTL